MEHALFVERARELLARVTYKDWGFELDEGILALRLRLVVPDSFTHEPTFHFTRWWRLSRFMTNSEVVQTAFKAVLTAEEHEVRERFTYRLQPIFGPHFDIERLVELCDLHRLDVRTKA